MPVTLIDKSNYPTDFVIPIDQKSSLRSLIRNKIKGIDESKLNLKLKLIKWIDQQSNGLDQILPDLPAQKKVDEFIQLIDRRFEKLKPFNDWIDSNNSKHWIKNLAIFLVKLPLKAARNILKLLYNLVKAAIFAVNHPLKSLAKMAKYLVEIIYQLSEPESWSILGAGLIGFSGGQALTGNPLSVIGFIVGAALLLSGLSLGALKSALKAEEGNVKEEIFKNLSKQAKAALESASTGLIMGLILGAIQKTLYDKTVPNYRVTNIEEAQKFAEQFIKDNGLPPFDTVQIDPSGGIVIHWENGNNVSHLLKKFPEYAENTIQYPGRVIYGSSYDSVTFTVGPETVKKVYNYMMRKLYMDDSSLEIFPYEYQSVAGKEAFIYDYPKPIPKNQVSYQGFLLSTADQF